MGNKSAKQQAQTGSCGYWPYSNNGFGNGYGSPYFDQQQQNLTHGSIKMINTLTKVPFNHKW